MAAILYNVKHTNAGDRIGGIMDTSKICYIVGGGADYGLPFTPGEHDLVIAADAGFRSLDGCGIPADYIIGDFDSLDYIPQSLNVIRLSPEKDMTDMSAAVDIGIERGYKLFHLYGGTGGRIDHTIANLQLIASLAGQDKQGFLFGQDSVITAIHNTSLSFREIPSGYISVFSHTEQSFGVYLRGLKYELTDAMLKSTFPLGVSNEFTGTKSSITVENGTLLIVMPCQSLAQIEWSI